MVAMGVGALVAAAVGAVLGLAVIRLPGIYAALATLAFALMFEGVLVPIDWVSGGSTPLKVPRPLIAGIDFASDRAFLLLACACLAVVGLAVIAIRDGTTGRFLDAVRGSPTAARSIGINPTRQRLVVFVAGAAVAGFGGGLLSSYFGEANYSQSFTFFFSLVWVVLVITAGSRPGAGGGHVRRHVLRVPGPARQALQLARQLPGQPSRHLGPRPLVPRVLQPGLVAGRGVHPVRPGCAHLRQAPRGGHRGPGLGGGGAPRGLRQPSEPFRRPRPGRAARRAPHPWTWRCEPPARGHGGDQALPGHRRAPRRVGAGRRRTSWWR